MLVLAQVLVWEGVDIQWPMIDQLDALLRPCTKGRTDSEGLGFSIESRVRGPDEKCGYMKYDI